MVCKKVCYDRGTVEKGEIEDVPENVYDRMGW